jgi:hypothetical protein
LNLILDGSWCSRLTSESVPKEFLNFAIIVLIRDLCIMGIKMDFWIDDYGPSFSCFENGVTEERGIVHANSW